SGPRFRAAGGKTLGLRRIDPAHQRLERFPAKHAPGLDPGVETGSRQENASNQKSRAPFRFHRNGVLEDYRGFLGMPADPLKLIALDADDLAVISAHVQDARVQASDIVWRQDEKRLVVGIDRLDWEQTPPGMVGTLPLCPPYGLCFRSRRVDGPWPPRH